MILQALDELCDRESLLGDDANYELKKVPWIIQVGRNGEFLGMIDNRKRVTVPTKSARGQPRLQLVARYRWVPREPERTSGDYALFLCDTTEYLFGTEAPAKKGARRPSNKLEKRRNLFRDKIKECFEATEDEGIGALLALLDQASKDASQIRVDDECDASDLITFVYAPDVDRLIGDRPKVRDYWSEHRKREIEEQPLVTCLVTAKRDRACAKHPLLKRVPGGTPSGVALVSFNAPAFESYGLEGNENAPVSHRASVKCGTAFNRLLNPEPPNPRNPDESLPSRNYRLSADTAVCFWAVSDSAQDFCNQFAPILEANPDDVRQAYHSIWRGKAPPDLDPSDFYALTLSGSQGRAIVRDWFESTLPKVAGNLALHFADLAMVRNCPPPRKGGQPPSYPLRTLLEAMADPVKRRTEGIPGHLAAQIAHCALSSQTYPRSAVFRAVNRYRLEIGKEHDEREGWLVRNWNDHRAAMIKATLNRLIRSGQTHFVKKEATPDMNPNSESDGYVLGQLMAVFERLQQLALDNPNASVVDRFFSGASAAPKSVFIRLYKNARHHARKARDDKKNAGLAFLLEKIVDELSTRFGIDPNARDFRLKMARPQSLGFPAHLSIEEQGMFIIGYHQMRHWIWLNKETRRAWEANHANAPKAFQWTKQREEAAAQTGAAVDV